MLGRPLRLQSPPITTRYRQARRDAAAQYQAVFGRRLSGRQWVKLRKHLQRIARLERV